MLDTLCTKTIDTTTTAGTYYPVGANSSGGASVDEFLLNSGPIGNQLEFGINVPSKAGTNPTLDATVEFSDSASFATILHTMTFKQITGADTFPLNRRVHGTTRATYARLKLVTGGTNPGFGVVTAWMAGPQTHHEGQGATSD